MYSKVLRVIGCGLVMNIFVPWTATWAAPRPVEPRLELNTHQIPVPTLQWGADGQMGSASLPGGITLTVDATRQLGWFTLSHPDWVGDLSCNMSLVVDDDNMEVIYTIVFYDHDGVVVDIISGTISQDHDRPSDVRIGLVRHADGVSAEAVFQPSLASVSVVGERALTPVSGGYDSDGSRVTAEALAGVILIVVAIIIVINWIFSDSYDCTTAWKRFWNNC